MSFDFELLNVVSDDLKSLIKQDVSADDVTLKSVFDIEHLMLLIGSMEDRIDYYADLKKHRIQSIDKISSELKRKVDSYRDVALRTMQSLEPSKKTLDFPGVGKISRRKKPGTWEVHDEHELVSILDRKGLKGDVVKESLDLRKVKAVLDKISSEGQTIDLGVASKSPDSESVSISFDKNAQEKINSVIDDNNASSSGDSDISHLSGLEV